MMRFTITAITSWLLFIHATLVDLPWVACVAGAAFVLSVPPAFALIVYRRNRKALHANG